MKNDEKINVIVTVQTCDVCGAPAASAADILCVKHKPKGVVSWPIDAVKSTSGKV